MDRDQAKLFVGGISRETSEATLKDHFDKYGSVLGSVVAIDRSTKNPRGFGFVWFSDPSSAVKALTDKHVIGGRTVSFLITFLLCFVANHGTSINKKIGILNLRSLVFCLFG